VSLAAHCALWRVSVRGVSDSSDVTWYWSCFRALRRNTGNVVTRYAVWMGESAARCNGLTEWVQNSNILERVWFEFGTLPIRGICVLILWSIHARLKFSGCVCSLHQISLGSSNKMDRMGGVYVYECTCMWRNEKHVQTFSRKVWRKRPLGRPRYGWG
jgi:hypothetical protein